MLDTSRWCAVLHNHIHEIPNGRSFNSSFCVFLHSSGLLVRNCLSMTDAEHLVFANSFVFSSIIFSFVNIWEHLSRLLQAVDYTGCIKVLALWPHACICTLWLFARQQMVTGVTVADPTTQRGWRQSHPFTFSYWRRQIVSLSLNACTQRLNLVWQEAGFREMWNTLRTFKRIESNIRKWGCLEQLLFRFMLAVSQNSRGCDHRPSWSLRGGSRLAKLWEREINLWF